MEVYNHTIEEIMTAKQKENILKAIKSIDIDCTDFYHTYEGSRRGFNTITKSVEFGEYDVELVVTEEVQFESHEDIEFVDLKIDGITVRFQGEEISADEITDEEIFKVLKY